MDSSAGRIVSAGADGWVRYWSIQSVIDADIDTDTSIDIYLEPTCEIQVSQSDSKCSIRWMLHGDFGGDHYFIRDSYGKLWKLIAPESSVEQVSTSCLAA